MQIYTFRYMRDYQVIDEAVFQVNSLDEAWKRATQKLESKKSEKDKGYVKVELVKAELARK